MEGPFKGRVVAHAKGVALDDARTIVSQAGRERVLREGRKNVHAYIEGYIHAVQDVQMRYWYDMGVHHVSDVEVVSYGRWWEAVRYNPYGGPLLLGPRRGKYRISGPGPRGPDRHA